MHGAGNAYDNARLVEARGMAVLGRFLDEHADGRVVLLDKGPLARALQETTGDAIFQMPDKRVWSLEIKVEAEERYGNLFLETWSNKNLDDQVRHIQHGSNPGWMIKQRADLLFYYFLDTDRLYVLNLFRLQQWAWGSKLIGHAGKIYGYPEKPQSQRQQLNDTWGRCVPISVLAREVGIRVIYPKQLPLFPEDDQLVA